MRGFPRSFFAEVNKRCAPIRHANEHEAAASDVSCEGIRYSQRKPDGDRGIHRVPARFQDCYSHIRRQGFLRHHHPSARVNRFMCVSRWRSQNQDREKYC